jgi:hypothetical protein
MNFIKEMLVTWLFMAILFASFFVCYGVWILLVKLFGGDVGDTITLFLICGVFGAVLNLRR